MHATGTDSANVNITAPEVSSTSTYTLSVVVSDGKTSVQSNVRGYRESESGACTGTC